MAPKNKSKINKRRELKLLLPFLLIVLTVSIKTSSAESTEIPLKGNRVKIRYDEQKYIKTCETTEDEQKLLAANVLLH